MSQFLISLLLLLSPLVHAQTAADLQNQIDTSNAQISALQTEIAQLQTQLTATTKQKQTLQNAVTALNLNIKKITTSINLTNAQISQTDLQIQALSDGISTTTSEIGQVQDGVAESLQQVQQLDSESLAVDLLSGGTLSSFFDQAEELSALRNGLEGKITDLSSLKDTLTTTKTTAQQKRTQLATLQTQLAQQKQGLAIALDSQNQLLAQTKDQESTYQKQIAQKQTEETQFENDLQNYEAQLNLKVNPGALPKSGSAPLAWPLDPGFVITQYFGNTPFATANPQIYSGQGHDGVDLSASPGTRVLAARGGVVLGTGNTDLTCPGASFGKWVFIQHDDGLSTMYAHLSTILVTKGQTVSTGQLIAYSDTTGYATGPHLHFGVYATQGSEISSFASKGCPGKTYTMPVADLTAYLNPLSYLPPLPK